MASHSLPKSIQDDDESTIYTAITPPESVDVDFLNEQDPLRTAISTPPLVPWPGSTFIIRSVNSGQVLMLCDGKVLLAQPHARGSTHWACVELKGWLSFRNTVSGKFLGHDANGWLCCSAKQQQKWENFCVRMRPDRGCVLLMTHYERLWHVGIKVEQGIEKLAKIGEGANDGLAWEFVKV